MTTVIGKSIAAPPLVGATQTFLSIGAFDTEAEAVACQKYINTKFARALLSIRKVTQHNPPATWANVPLQDFTANSDINWNTTLPAIDWQLYRKYKLDLREIDFIESHIEYRKDLPVEWLGGAYKVVGIFDTDELNKSLGRGDTAGDRAD